VMGVQWHPERMDETDPIARGLFSDLIAVAGLRKMPARA